MSDQPKDPTADPRPAAREEARPALADRAKTPERGGPKGPEPTRYGDWERDGRCVDF